MRITRTLALTSTGLVAAAVLSACGTSADGSASSASPADQAAASSPSTPAAPAEPATPADTASSADPTTPTAPSTPTSASSTPTSASSAAARTPECTAADMSAAYRGGDAATSHRFGKIVLTNTSDAACRIKGYGGLSYVGGGKGVQVGAAADRDRATKVRPFVVLPGGHAWSEVSETTTGPYSAKECKPRPVDGFRVYVPDETASLYVKHPTTGCAAGDVHLLSHRAYTPS